MSEVVQVQDITKTYGEKGEKQYQALKGISFDVARDEFAGIMGASGSSKTTLLNILSTLDQPTTGNVYINGRDITGLGRNQMADFRGQEIGFILRDFNLLENLADHENIALSLSLQNVEASAINPKVDKIAGRLGIGHILNKYPTEISGGQKQRVAAARALVHEPATLHGDESTGALDSKSTTELLETVKGLNEKDRVSILMVTHDPHSASYASRILFVKDGKIGKEIKKNDRSREKFYRDVIAELGRR